LGHAIIHSKRFFRTLLAVEADAILACLFTVEYGCMIIFLGFNLFAIGLFHLNSFIIFKFMTLIFDFVLYQFDFMGSTMLSFQ
jgi:hypothetical protein